MREVNVRMSGWGVGGDILCGILYMNMFEVEI